MTIMDTMWFSDLSESQQIKIASKIRQAESYIDRGWTTGSRVSGNKMCMIGAVSMAVYGDPFHSVEHHDPIGLGVSHAIAVQLGAHNTRRSDAVLAEHFLMSTNDSSHNPKKLLSAMNLAAEHFENNVGKSHPRNEFLRKPLIKPSTLARIPLYTPKPDAFADATQKDMQLAAGPGE